MSSSSLDDILRQIKESVSDVMNNEAKSEAKKIVAKHVKTDVYSYKPKTYGHKRRGEFGKEENVKVDVKGKGNGFEMEVDEIVKGRNGFDGLADVTETGTGGNWNGKVPARPFMEKSSKELEDKVANSLKKGLKSRGFKVE